jgi:Fur family transcriptional regulator, iron response regulator
MESFAQFDAEERPSTLVETTPSSVRDRLENAGLRPTLQRLDLGQVIFGRGHRHFTAEMLFEETRALRYPPSLATIYNTLGQFAKCGLLREIAVYDAKLWYDTKTGPHFHFYREDTDELFDIPKDLVPQLDIPAPQGTRVQAIDVIVRLTRA